MGGDSAVGPDSGSATVADGLPRTGIELIGMALVGLGLVGVGTRLVRRGRRSC